MRRAAQTPAWPGTLNPSRVPSPQDPVGRKREHTPRHDSRQWSVGSSKSRQTSLQGGASGQKEQIPSPSSPYGRRRSYKYLSESPPGTSSSQSNSAHHQPGADLEGKVLPKSSGTPSREAPLPGFHTPESSDRGPNAQRKLRLQEKPEKRQPRNDRGHGRGIEQSKRPEEQIGGKDGSTLREHDTQLSESAPGPDFMQLTSSDSDSDEHIAGSSGVPKRAREDAHASTPHVVMPKFQPAEFVDLNTPCVSPSKDSELNNAFQSVRQSHRALNEALNSVSERETGPGHARNQSFGPFLDRPNGQRVSKLEPLAAQEPRRPSWARVGHHGIKSWEKPNCRAKIAEARTNVDSHPEKEFFPRSGTKAVDGIAERAASRSYGASPQMNALIDEVEAGIQETRKVSETSTMSNWRDAAIEAVLRKSVEAETANDLPPPIPRKSSRQNLRASVIEHLQRNAEESSHLKGETEDELGIAQMQTLRRNQAALIDTTSPAQDSVANDQRYVRRARDKEPAMSNRLHHGMSILPSVQTRFVEHLPENEDKLRRLGLVVGRKRRGSAWFQSLRRKAK
ncbi:hypothetical protein CKM354_000081700 [Cercospora kikuchii]|uniref:Uncharacterized protein n=1 Tax=Cercospora kikuchii TaxID=84275 RepID=A0A9P3FBC5_9PEZI|nr:uncharacterized protein CKM354_000081700 [Cercospora kikuchii]GIZ37367.1 hypothetical protein CKM354_000081700 [Cercospora kikuchii]